MAPNPEKVYEGKPCKNCGNTLRYKANHKLICKYKCDKKERERIKKWSQSEKGKESHKRAQIKYDKTEKRKQCRRRYNQSEIGKATNKRLGKKWHEQVFWGDGPDSILKREKKRSQDRLRYLKTQKEK